jgi:hypothetical protein
MQKASDRVSVGLRQTVAGEKIQLEEPVKDFYGDTTVSFDVQITRKIAMTTVSSELVSSVVGITGTRCSLIVSIFQVTI